MTELTAIKAMLAKCTPGEWRAGRPDMLSYDTCGGRPFKYVYIGKSQEIKVQTRRPVADSQLIGAAPSLLRELIDRLRKAEKVVEAAKVCVAPRWADASLKEDVRDYYVKKRLTGEDYDARQALINALAKYRALTGESK